MLSFLARLPRGLTGVLLLLPPVYWIVTRKLRLLSFEPWDALWVAVAVYGIIALAYLFDLERPRRLHHPILGDIETAPGLFWSRRRTWALGMREDLVSGHALAVFLEGSTSAPDAQAVDALATFPSELDRLRPEIAAALLGFLEEDWRERAGEALEEGEELSGSEQFGALTLRVAGDWLLDLRFSWQPEEDPHYVTVQVRGGSVEGVSSSG